MTAELVRGENHVLAGARLEIRISAGEPVLAGAVLVDSAGSTRGTDWFAHPGAPQLPGLEVPRQAAVNHRLAVDLEALPEDATQVRVLLALPQGAGGPLSFASLAAPYLAVTSLEGAELASYTVIGLGSESAVIAIELYRRGGSWKVRAVGQGYADGLGALLHDQGLPQSAELASGIHAAVAGAMARSVPAPPRQTAPVGGEPADNGAQSPEGTRSQPGVTGSQSGTPTPGPGATAPHGGVNYQHPG
ncbi:TerD family protein, partial [Streptomyces tardus]|uniref:TerD family protein n=1 Tax=Streptomyces tardus TaxID=2780544 RepID=UPI001F1A6544